MKLFKFVGNRPDPTLLSIWSGKPENDEVHKRKQIHTLRQVYHDQIGRTLRSTNSFFLRCNRYDSIAPQFNALDRLLEYADQCKYVVTEVTPCENQRGEFLLRVLLSIPVLPMYNRELFKVLEPFPEGTKGYVNVAFYVGLCNEFTSLLSQNHLLGTALAACTDRELINDPAYNVERVIPGILKGLRLDRRYLYVVKDRRIDDRHFYQSAEGYLYRINIEGYTAHTP